MKGNVLIKENYFYISSFKNEINIGNKIRLTGGLDCVESGSTPPLNKYINHYETAPGEEVFEFDNIASAKEYILNEISDKHYPIFIAKEDTLGIYLNLV